LAAEPQPDAQVTDLFPNLGESSYEERPAVVHAPAHTRRAGRDPAHLEAGRSFGGYSLRRDPPDCTSVSSLRSGTTSKGLLQASRSPGCCRFQRPYHSLDSGPKVADLDDRLKASVTAEHKATVCSNQQATSLTELTARLQQQLDSSRANDELIS